MLLLVHYVKMTKDDDEMNSSEGFLDYFDAVGGGGGVLVDGAFVLDRVDGCAPVAMLRAVGLVHFDLKTRPKLVTAIQLHSTIIK